MELQFAYEAMRRHFARYGDEPAAAYEGNGCKYRTSDGRCCAVGCLIPPALYDERLDESTETENAVGSVYGFLNRREAYVGAVAEFLGITQDNVGAWSALQGAHDDAAIAANAEGRVATGNEVVRRLDKAAKEYGLETPETIYQAHYDAAKDEIAQRFAA